jgi:hypothetical protein
VANGATVYFQLPYLPNSVLTQLRVKWQAEGNNDGVKVRLIKRDESGTAAGWTLVGRSKSILIPVRLIPLL